MNQIDRVLQTVTPTVMVPRHEAFEPMANNGHRFLVADNGLWLEVRRSWCYLRVPIAKQSSVAMPYGKLEEVVDLAFKIPKPIVAEFVRIARTRLPNECAAWVIWNEETGAISLQMLEEISVGPGHANVVRPALAEGEHMVVDLHSHGCLSAFFSGTDDRDDRGEVKVAGVVGNCDTAEPSLAFRICVLGKYLPIPFCGADIWQLL